MIILGKNTDDVGAQLEKLTKKLLEHRGYKNVATDTIGEGGNEIDVQAENPSKIPSSTSFRRLIAECKAWANPVNLPDWLKFLGKVLVEEAKLGNEVEALFVALSGVNGAVRGNYDSLRQRKQNIVLLEGESLTEELSTLYKLPQSSIVAGHLKQFTELQYSSMELAYYNEQFYWIFTFPDRDIAILTANGEPADLASFGEVRTKLIERLDARKLIDLAAERLALERARDSKKYLLTSLFESGGKLPLSFTSTEQGGFSIGELQNAVKQCEKAGWLLPGQDSIALSFDSKSRTDSLISALRFILTDGLKRDDWEKLARSKLFDEVINEEFFKQISIVQGNLSLDTDFKSKLRLMVKISPSALAYAIHPDPMIITSRVNQPEAPRDDIEDCHRLMRSFLSMLRKDFKKGVLARYLYYDCGLREIEVVEHYRIKNESTTILEQEVKQRTMIGIADESLGGGLLYVDVLSRAPEPWELFKPKPTAEGEKDSP